MRNRTLQISTAFLLKGTRVSCKSTNKGVLQEFHQACCTSIVFAKIMVRRSFLGFRKMCTVQDCHIEKLTLSYATVLQACPAREFYKILSTAFWKRVLPQNCVYSFTVYSFSFQIAIRVCCLQRCPSNELAEVFCRNMLYKMKCARAMTKVGVNKSCARATWHDLTRDG